MGPEWIIVAVVAVAVLFGAKKIPEIARGVGRAQGEFKKGLKEGVVDDGSESEQSPPSQQPQQAQAQQARQPQQPQQQPGQPPQQPGANGSGTSQA